MLDIRRILCPIDFSEASQHALDHAVMIAGWYRARITALHVRHPHQPEAAEAVQDDLFKSLAGAKQIILVAGLGGGTGSGAGASASDCRP